MFKNISFAAAPRRAMPLAGVLIGIVALSGNTVALEKRATPHLPIHTKAVERSAVAPRPLLLVYPFKPGETRRYELKALFNGHFPPFSQPGSQPIHLLGTIEYVAKVIKQDAQGAQVEFTVDAAEFDLLKDEVALDAPIKPDNKVDLGVQLPDVQKTLNTTVVLRPDGSIANVVNEGPNIVHINIGFDLRKLFLLTMPVIFPKTPVHMGDSWTSTTGVLGAKPGSIHYVDKLKSVSGGAKGLTLQIGQVATSTINDTLDKNGSSTSKSDDIISTLTGTIVVNSDLKFQAVPASVAAGNTSVNARGARMTAGLFKLQALLDRKVTKNDVTPEIREANEGKIDVTAHMLVLAK